MGWLDGILGQSSNGSDPLQKLDPKLREFLEKESPVKYKPATSEAPRQDQATGAPAQQATDKSTAASQSEAEKRNAVPKESLFQDGRYAHLWKNYRPQAEIEHENKSDHEKLEDVMDGFKERKAQIGRTAMENCALEQMDWNDCMKAGDWGQKFTMCSAEVRKFERCFTMQSRLLRALGYLSSPDRTQDEVIQMHADKLYHRMLEQEAMTEKAKAEGAPAPKFSPLVTPPPAAQGSPDELWEKASEEAKKRWKQRLDNVPPEERATEDAAIRAEMRARAEIASRVQVIWDESRKSKEQRKEEGKETWADKISGLLGGTNTKS